MLLKHPLEGLKGKGAQEILNRCLYLQKEHRFSAFCFGPSARFLEKLSLISLLKSDWKIHVFPLLTLSNVKKILIFQKKKRWFSERNKVPFSHVISLWGSGWGRPWGRLVREIRCQFLTLFGFGGSRGGPLGETPSPSRHTWLSETPSLGVGGGRRARTGESGRNRLGARLGPREGGPARGGPESSPETPAKFPQDSLI